MRFNIFDDRLLDRIKRAIRLQQYIEFKKKVAEKKNLLILKKQNEI
jgi:hypothetical protein